MPFDITHANLSDIWSEDTGETVGEALNRFASFGPEVPAEDVPALVSAGHRVWSFGYGDDPEEFTTIDQSDLDNDMDDDDLAEWSPFRLDSQDPDFDLVLRYNGGRPYTPPVPRMDIEQALAIVKSRLEAVESVGGRVWTAISVLDTHVTQVLGQEAVEAANPNGHQMGHNLCIYCLNYDMDPREDCPDREEES